jgi:hypothetical protein
VSAKTSEVDESITKSLALDVTITYEPLPDKDGLKRFDDLVEYRKQSSSRDSSLSTGA